MVDLEKSYNFQIWCGLKNVVTGEEKTIEDVEEILQNYCDNHGFCFSLTPTKFIYTEGKENGVMIGIINYPRFPKKESDIDTIVKIISQKLLKELEQCRITVCGPNWNIMFSNNEQIKKIEECQ